ncbi:hypothetical protein N0O92_04660 [Alkalihalobacillus sp. MEB130]|uniref:hypothetical protein n=1 Tax=Alkalihalobacillus sp. MEB130 TaxID=2976704 RepID=UPI0028DE00FF|nr:hypothetical protein [Alkalihalobacillus sp. MEB130]MDT8859515.1 hypothetical protein [Alkalihalobacillus sp. MEB130]
MKEWVKAKQQTILLMILLLLVLLAAIQFSLVRPLQLEHTAKEQEWQATNSEVKKAESVINQLQPQAVDPKKKDSFFSSVPPRAHVEQLIADLERIEHSANVTVSNLTISLLSNDVEEQSGIQESQIEELNQSQLNELDHKDYRMWEGIFSNDVITAMSSELEEIHHLTLSPVDVNVQFTGDEEAVTLFVEEVENMRRAVHIQNFTYTTNNSQLTANVWIRAYYSEDFEEFIEGEQGLVLSRD